MEVTAVGRRGVRLVEAHDDVPRDAVPLLLTDENLAGEVTALGEGLEHLLEQRGGP